ncbi:MAG: hypothetical protein KJZ70_07790 [Bryobacterales bacterium]|nr:hypothetical protein [Bryobacterales bacterium]
MNPVEYAERYRNLSIHADGQTQNNVRVEIYRIGKPDDEQGKLWQALKDHFRAKKQKEPSYALTLNVNGNQERFDSTDKLLRHVVNPFWGKGSPEDCQISLSIAVLMGRTTMARVQAYANDHVGLDCNGFVGNYLWRERLQNSWKLHPGKHESPAPSANIASIITWAASKSKENGVVVEKLEDLDSEKMYLMAMVDKHLKVIPGGPSSPSGHIVITQPKRYMATSFVWDSLGFYDMGWAKKGAYGHPAYWVVESTGPELRVGLRESWYAMRVLLNKKKEPVPGIFDVFRGSKAEALNFRVVPVP